MTETERVRVGVALDMVRGALSPYVDDAMTTAYGSDWGEMVAEEDAQRRASSRKQHVSKSDLAVMLKAIQFRRIAPWWSEGTYPNPRIRSYASEILNTRNFYSHGDECLNEHARLVDTAVRLLGLLEIDVPSGLAAPSLPDRPDGGLLVSAQPAGALDVVNAQFEAELANQGEAVESAMKLLATSQTIQKVAYRTALESYDAEPGSAEAELIAKDLPGTAGFSLDRPLGQEVVDVMSEAVRLKEKGERSGSAVLQVFAQLVLCTLLDQPAGIAVMGAALQETAETGDPDQIGVVNRLMAQFGAGVWRELRRLAKLLPDRTMSGAMIVLANTALVSDPTTENSEGLALVRDTTDRLRVFAANEPGSFYETWLVNNLRVEGRLCNDLGKPDDAMRAFARADEIIDRYPTADPDLSR